MEEYGFRNLQRDLPRNIHYNLCQDRLVEGRIMLFQIPQNCLMSIRQKIQTDKQKSINQQQQKTEHQPKNSQKATGVN